MRAATAMAAIVLAAAPAHAGSPFDGLWVADLDTQAGQAGFDKYLVANGTYSCESCNPPRRYPVDGRTRSVAGDLSALGESVTIVGRRIMVTRTVEREMTRTTRMTVARDGRTATYISLDRWRGRTRPLRTVYVARRAAPAPPGAHAVSGAWLGLRYIAVPEEYRSVRLMEKDGQFTRIDFRRGRYTARIGGPAAPVTDDGKNVFEAIVRAPTARVRIETISFKGKPLVERTYTLSPDGKSLVTAVRDPESGSTFTTESHRK